MVIFIRTDVSMTFRAVKIIGVGVAAATDTATPLVGLFFGLDLFYTFLHKAVFSAFFGQLPVAPFISACDSVAIGAG